MGININLCLGNCGTLQGIAGTILSLINNVLVPLIFAVAFVVFLWGVFQYFIYGGADETAQEKGRSLILYGLIGFFIMVSLWGLVNILSNTFGLGGYARPNYPTL
jgi:hypothetical protein